MSVTYLDWAATAPLRAESARVVADACQRLESGEWANPSSQHGPGRAARRAIEEARQTIAAALSVAPESLVFTSGGTEALALALRGSRASARAILATEHAAVREAAPDALVLPVDSSGRLVEAALAALPEDALVAVQAANNETGVIQDLARIAGLVHARRGRLVADCVQSAGKLPLPAAADFVAISAHKLGGPPGVGALAVRCRDSLEAIQRGGGQEQGLRGGTENLPGILGFAAAVAALDHGLAPHASALQARLEAGVRAAGGRIIGEGAPRLPTISCIHLPGVPAANQLIAMDLAGIAVSQGPACSSGTLRPSAVLAAMGETDAAGESLRVSTGWTTTMADIDRFLEVWKRLAERRRAA